MSPESDLMPLAMLSVWVRPWTIVAASVSMIRAMPRMPEPAPAVWLMLRAVRLIVPATLLMPTATVSI
jgi:hypothetical protein